jgi:hypothetical protein
MRRSFGVTQYLTVAAIVATLAFVLSLPSGSEIRVERYPAPGCAFGDRGGRCCDCCCKIR